MAASRWLLVPVALGACGLDPVPSVGTTGTPGTSDETDTGASSSSSDSTGEDIPPEPGLETHGSGSRLRAIELVTPGDGVLLLAFHDTELDIDCVFATSSDGVVRCLPWWGLPQVHLFRDTSGTGEATVFARRAGSCDGPVAIVEGCMVEAGDQIALPPLDGCDARIQRAESFRVGASVPASEF